MMRAFILFFAAATASAQTIDLSSLDRFAAKASESRVVSLDGEKLRLALGFLSAEDQKQAKMRELIAGLKSVFVRSFEFDKPGQYAQADLDPVRAQLKNAPWSKIVDVKSPNESSEVFIHTTAGKMTGLAVIASERNELTVVSITGELAVETLAELGGIMGIPRLPLEKTQPPRQKKDE